MTNYSVVIAGAGPTGLMLAAELAIAGVDVAIVERRPDQTLAGTRAGGLLPRTLELLDQRGVVERFTSQGQPHRVAPFVLPLDLTDLPSRHNYILAIAQTRVEQILADWVTELGVTILRSRDVVTFAQDDSGVDLQLSTGDSLRARYLVGCDGGRSVVRKLAGIAFTGWDASTGYLLAEASMTGEIAAGFRKTATGTHALGKLGDGDRVRVVLETAPIDSEPTVDDLRAALVAIYGTDFGLHDVTWLSRFTDAARQAAAYRDRRVLLAGDAAHTHSPIGGQGLNTGVQDAANLGWKLARVVRGIAPDALLDSYHSERHPVATRVLRTTLAQTALRRADDRSQALSELFGEVVALDGPRQRIAARMTGVDIHYDLGPGHPLLGRRMPDLDLVTADGPRRVAQLLHDARYVRLTLGAPGAIAEAPDGTRHVAAHTASPWLLPVLGAVPAPSSVLIRPDGYVAEVS